MGECYYCNKEAEFYCGLCWETVCIDCLQIYDPSNMIGENICKSCYEHQRAKNSLLGGEARRLKKENKEELARKKGNPVEWSVDKSQKKKKKRRNKFMVFE